MQVKVKCINERCSANEVVRTVEVPTIAPGVLDYPHDLRCAECGWGMPECP